MAILIKILVLIGVFCLMEFVSWFTHKYIMHGFLWFLHKDHHQVKHRPFQRNDFFFLIFAIPSMILFYLGFPTFNLLFFAGAGILMYGLAYFFVHDVLIHQRIKWFRGVNKGYFMALRRAHKMHHKHLQKNGGESFGMLIVPLKYLKKKY